MLHREVDESDEEEGYIQDFIDNLEQQQAGDASMQVCCKTLRQRSRLQVLP